MALVGCAGEPAAPAHAGPARLALAPAALDEAGEGVRAGLAEAGLRDGQDYVWVDATAAGSEMPDVWMAAAPQALSAALGAAGARPVIFTDVANPGAAGARAPSLLRRWAPWLLRDLGTPVTGVMATSDFEALLEAAAPLLGTRAVGVVFAAGDADSEAWHGRLMTDSAPAGRAVISVALDEPGGAPAAVARLCERGAGAMLLLGDRATDAAVPALVAAAQGCGLPVLGTRRAHAPAGAIVTLARDVRGAGRAAGVRAAKALRGDDVGRLAFAEDAGEQRWMVNADAAGRAGIGLPLALIERADEVLGD